MLVFRSTFQLTPQEEEVLRRAGKDPESYIALPVAVELDPSRPVELVRIPPGPHGPARQVIRVPLHVGIESTWLHYSTLVGVNGQSARNPVDGMIAFMPARMVLPQRNFTEAGQAAVAAHIEQEKAAYKAARAAEDWEPSVEDAPPTTTTRTITILDADGNPVDPASLPENVVLRLERAPVAPKALPDEG